MKKHVALALALFSITAAAAQIDMSGSLQFFFDEFREINGNKWYSMNGNGNIFGTGDWKQSTNDNWNDNRDKFQAILNLNSNVKLNENTNINLGFETIIDELIGQANGSGITYGQEFATVRDNSPLIIKDITLTTNTDIGKFTLTNNFNFDFNKRVLAMQLEDNWGEPLPYGEGVLLENDDVYGFTTKTFMFQASEAPSSIDGKDVTTNTASNLTQNDLKSTKLVYGFDVKKDFGLGNIGVLAVNVHDKSSEISGSNFGKDLDTLRLAVNGEFAPIDLVSIKGEYIIANYGKDVTSVMNTTGQVIPWITDSYDLSGVDAKKDNTIVDATVVVTPFDDLEVSVGYKNVGEDYTAVLGNSQRHDSWLGNASFAYEDGTGYEKGYNGKIVYTLPFDLIVKTTVDYTNYDKTRSALNDNEDTNETQLLGKVEINEDKWGVAGSYRRLVKTNSGKDVSNGGVEETDILYNDYNVNARYALVQGAKLNTNINVDVNYYTGDDNTISQNFSNEQRIKVGTSSDYKMNDKTTLYGSYNFGYATENNDVIKDAYGRQYLIKTGIKYVVNDVTFDLMYKYDNYKLNREASKTELENSVYKKEVSHVWYDGLESWSHSGSDWENWMWDVADDYSGYITHELKASITVAF
ncbi:hypothetical protein EV215_1007 [Hypnocyclicus thermotrophus]|uniref:Autotransporter outer membrane beta-barrel domain-containing protein n=1 Tax=Hypnocyclicus thermotrophus TaxID=1627895 RepID=A0AA46I5J0_9FUSO|nr:hypothetical protein [Hypnocyclicus thermotrophus]TDT70462.1 hypothetical protein EV215_1007 [Hypnocyclicus thermotrophus]